ncbi:Glycopeptide antibiotics resistance protein [Cellulosimicrobium cellulans J34]|nr:Glycopeptide antibiotics resistance protein [Cellulosimicrobium cellulans J34]SMF04449.1 Glycopeptide antibiotics resistance protein [Cellulosimicrobium cellulans J1]
MEGRWAVRGGSRIRVRGPYAGVVRLLTWTFAAYLAAVLVVTLWPSPQSTDAPGWATATLGFLQGLGIPITLPVLEALANVVMFGPFGLLGVPLARGAGARRRGVAPGPWRTAALVTLAGCALSVAIELTQHLLPGRVPTVQDVVMNTAGAFLGAALVALAVVAASARRRVVAGVA